MIPTIDVATLKQKLANNDDFFLLDVRQPHEHEAIRIQDGVLIPLGELPDRVQELEAHRNRDIVVYCRSGARSAQATSFLQQLGYRCFNLSGGILSWSASSGQAHEG